MKISKIGAILGFGFIFSCSCMAQPSDMTTPKLTESKNHKETEESQKNKSNIKLVCRYQYKNPFLDQQITEMATLDISFGESPTLKVSGPSGAMMGSYALAKPETDVYKTQGRYFTYTDQFLNFWFTSHSTGGSIYYLNLDRYTGQLKISIRRAVSSDFSEWYKVDGGDSEGICNKELERLF